jgi:hypothetical protein
VQLVAFSVLVSALLFTQTAQVAPVAPIAPPTLETFKEIGKTSYGTVLMNPASVRLDTSDGHMIAGMLLKIKLNKPQRGTHAIMNAVIFSCDTESVLVVSSTNLGAQDEPLSSSDKKVSLPWVKGSDSATNIVMEKMCKGHKKPLPRGVLET